MRQKKLILNDDVKNENEKKSSLIFSRFEWKFFSFISCNFFMPEFKFFSSLSFIIDKWSPLTDWKYKKYVHNVHCIRWDEEGGDKFIYYKHISSAKEARKKAFTGEREKSNKCMCLFQFSMAH